MRLDDNLYAYIRACGNLIGYPPEFIILHDKHVGHMGSDWSIRLCLDKNR